MICYHYQPWYPRVAFKYINLKDGTIITLTAVGIGYVSYKTTETLNIRYIQFLKDYEEYND